MKKLVLIFLFFLPCVQGKAQVIDTLQQHRFEMRSTLLGVGATNVYDTYLSPLEYKGVEARIYHERMRFTAFGGGKFSIQTILQGHVSTSNNKADNNRMLSGLLNWSYALHRQFQLSDKWKVMVGPMVDVNLGFMYNMRNSNNPASMYTYMNLGLSGMAIYRSKILGKRFTFRYQLNAPLLGLRFSPEYMQSYYEIFTLKNNNVKNWVFTSVHNQPSLRQLLSVDFSLGTSVLRLAYLGDIQQSKLNQLRTHTYTHAFMIGFVRSIFKIKTKKLRSLPVY